MSSVAEKGGAEVSAAKDKMDGALDKAKTESNAKRQKLKDKIKGKLDAAKQRYKDARRGFKLPKDAMTSDQLDELKKAETAAKEKAKAKAKRKTGKRLARQAAKKKLKDKFLSTTGNGTVHLTVTYRFNSFSGHHRWQTQQKIGASSG